MKILLTFFLLCTFLQSEVVFKDAKWTLLWSTNDTFISALDFAVTDNDIFVLDNAPESPVVIFSTDGKLKSKLGKQGNGPGEILSPLALNIIGKDDKGKLLLYDMKKRKMLVYTIAPQTFFREIDLDMVKPLNISLFKNILYINTADFSPSFFTRIDFKGYVPDFKTKTYLVPYETFRELENCAKNYLVKQGSLCHDSRGNVFFTFRQSSLVFGMEPSGKIIFKNLEPYNVDVPDYSKGVSKNQIQSLPVNEYPEINIDISVDEKYIYCLYSDFHIPGQGSRLEIINYAMNNLNKGNILTIYDKKSGSYLFSVHVPLKVNRIQVTKNSIYFLTDQSLLKYNKPDIFNYGG